MAEGVPEAAICREYVHTYYGSSTLQIISCAYGQVVPRLKECLEVFLVRLTALEAVAVQPPLISGRYTAVPYEHVLKVSAAAEAWWCSGRSQNICRTRQHAGGWRYFGTLTLACRHCWTLRCASCASGYNAL